MQEQCSGGEFNNSTLQYTSNLLNFQSNCFSWKAQYENAFEMNPTYMSAGLISSLDRAKANYCASQNGQLSAECSCLSFPINYSEQCDKQDNFGCTLDPSSSLPVPGEAICHGKNFLAMNQNFIVNGQSVTGAYVQFSFGECVPYYCWVESCVAQGNQLITSDIVASTNAGTCGNGVCISVVGTDAIGINYQSLQPPIGDNYTPAFNLFPPCGGGFAPATPNYIETVYSTPIDNALLFPIAIANNGSIFLNMQLQTQSVNWITLPQDLSIGPVSASRFVAEINNTLLQLTYSSALVPGDDGVVATTLVQPGGLLPTGFIEAPVFQYTYNDGYSSTLSTFTLQLDFVFGPPVGQIQKTVAKPTVSIIGASAAAVGLLILLIALIYNWSVDNAVLKTQRDVAVKSFDGVLAQKLAKKGLLNSKMA
jgi:hypothetical protein